MLVIGMCPTVHQQCNFQNLGVFIHSLMDMSMISTRAVGLNNSISTLILGFNPCRYDCSNNSGGTLGRRAVNFSNSG